MRLIQLITVSLLVVGMPQAFARPKPPSKPHRRTSRTTKPSTPRAEDALRRLVSGEQREVSIQVLAQAFAQIPRSSADETDFLSMPACKILVEARGVESWNREPILITGLERWTSRQGYKLLDAPFICFMANSGLIQPKDTGTSFDETSEQAAFRYRFRSEYSKLVKEIDRLAVERMNAANNATDFWLGLNWRALVPDAPEGSPSIADVAAERLIEREAKGLSLAGYLGIDGEKYDQVHGRVDGESYFDRDIDGLYKSVRKDLQIPFLRMVTRALTREPKTKWSNIHFASMVLSTDPKELSTDDWVAIKTQLLIEPDAAKMPDYASVLYRALGYVTPTEADSREITRFIDATDRDPFAGGREVGINAWPLGYVLLESPLAEEPGTKEILIRHFNKFNGTMDPSKMDPPLRALSSAAANRLRTFAEEPLDDTEFADLAKSKSWSLAPAPITFSRKLLLNNITSADRFDVLAKQVYARVHGSAYQQTLRWLDIKRVGSIWKEAKLDDGVRIDVTERLAARVASRTGRFTKELQNASAGAVMSPDLVIPDDATDTLEWSTLLEDMASLRELSRGRAPFVTTTFQLLRAGLDASIASKLSTASDPTGKVKLAIAASFAMTSGLTILADQNLSEAELAMLIKYAISPRVMKPSMGYFYLVAILGRSSSVSADAAKFFATVQPNPRDAVRLCDLMGFTKKCEDKELQTWYGLQSIVLQRQGYQLPAIDVTAIRR